MSTKRRYSDELRRKYGRISFGKLLAAWRDSEEMSQVQFAKKLGLSPANLCDIEQGRRIPSAVRAKRIAVRLGLPAKALVAIAIEDALKKEGMRYSVELKDVA